MARIVANPRHVCTVASHDAASLPTCLGLCTLLWPTRLTGKTGEAKHLIENLEKRRKQAESKLAGQRTSLENHREQADALREKVHAW